MMMKKIIGIGLVLALFIPLVGQKCFAEINKKWEPDWSWYSLTMANVVLGTLDVTMNLDKYRRGEIDKISPALMMTPIVAIIGLSYLVNKLGLNPLGHIILAGTLMTNGFVIFFNFAY